MRHCSSDPEVEVLLDPLSFSLFFPAFVSRYAYRLLYFDFEGLFVECIVCEWQQR